MGTLPFADTEPARYKSIIFDSSRWDGFRFREGDIVISTPPKCGTTWTQMICALLILQNPEFDQPLTQLSPWLDCVTQHRETVVTNLEAQQHRRFIKTHTPLDGLPFDERVTYLCVGRDLRDAGISAAHHFANLDVSVVVEARKKVGLEYVAPNVDQGPSLKAGNDREWFQKWVAVPTLTAPSLRYSLHHFSTFWKFRERDNILMYHYDDLKNDLPGQMRRLAGQLGITVDDDAFPALAGAGGFAAMRGRADQLVPGTGSNPWRDKSRFFNSGTSGQWKQVLDEEDLRLYTARVAELADDDLLAWVHREPLPPLS